MTYFERQTRKCRKYEGEMDALLTVVYSWMNAISSALSRGTFRASQIVLSALPTCRTWSKALNSEFHRVVQGMASDLPRCLRITSEAIVECCCFVQRALHFESTRFHVSLYPGSWKATSASVVASKFIPRRRMGLLVMAAPVFPSVPSREAPLRLPNLAAQTTYITKKSEINK